MSAPHLTPVADGLYTVHPPVATDARGRFAKPFHAPSFAAAGLVTAWAECYHSHSLPGVVRGMHYQAAPHQHAKLVWCTHGRVVDVALDLRPGPTFGRFHRVELSAENAVALYLPAGFAHGFAVPPDAATGATLLYLVSSPHAPEADTGVHFGSFGFDWADVLGAAPPVVSPRDAALPHIGTLKMPPLPST